MPFQGRGRLRTMGGQPPDWKGHLGGTCTDLLYLGIGVMVVRDGVRIIKVPSRGCGLEFAVGVSVCLLKSGCSFNLEHVD